MPWTLFFRLTMTTIFGGGAGADTGSGVILCRLRSGGGATATRAFHFLERGAHTARNRATRQFHRHDGAHLLDEAGGSHAQYPEVHRLGLRILAHRGGQRTEDSIAQQDSE